MMVLVVLAFGIFLDTILHDIIFHIRGLFTLLFLLVGMIGIEYMRGGSYHTVGFPLDSMTVLEIMYGVFLGIIPIASLIVIMSVLDVAEITYGSTLFADGIVAIIMYAVIEELIFRGMIFQACVDRFSFIPTAFMFSSFFALPHVANPSFDYVSMINTFLAGLLFSYARFHMHSLWLPIALHVSWNLTLFTTGMTLSGLEISESFMKVNLSHNIPSPWFMSSYGIEGTAYCTLALIVMGLIISTIHVPPQRKARIFRMEYAIDQ